MNLPVPTLPADTGINLLRRLSELLERVAADPRYAKDRALVEGALAPLDLYDTTAAGGTTLDTAFGLDRRIGDARATWWQVERRAERDRQLRAARVTYLGHLAEPADAARAMLIEFAKLARMSAITKRTLAAALLAANAQAKIPCQKKLTAILRNAKPGI